MMAKMNLKFFVYLIVVIGLLASAEAKTIHVAVPTLSMVVIAFTAAKGKGYYREEGLDVDLVQTRDTLGISALLGGNADCLHERRRLSRFGVVPKRRFR